MKRQTRREFFSTVSAAAVGTQAAPGLLRAVVLSPNPSRRVFVGSHAPDGILAFDWNAATATLTPAGVAAKVPAKVQNVAWLARSGDFIYSASELDTYEGKPT